MSSNTEVVTALNKVLARVGVAPVHSLREFDSLLLLRIFRRLFIGLPNDVLAEPRTRADHERNFNACVSHLSNSVLMMDLSHIDGAALAEADIEATRNLLEILDELHEIFQHDTVASPGRQATPPRRQRGLHSPETAPRTHSRTRTRARTSGSSRISLGDGAADDGEGSEGPVRALDNELAPWGTDEGSDAASIGRTDGIRRLPTQRAARLQPRSDASRARMRQTYGLRAQPNADLRTGRAQLGRVEYSPKGGARPARAAVPVSKHEFGGAARPRSSSAGRARPRSGGAIGGEAQGPTVRDVLRSRGGGRASSAPRARWTPTVPVALQPTTWARTMTYHGVEEDVRRLTSAMHAARARATAHVAQAKAHALGQEDGGLGYGGHEAEIAISLGTDARTGEPLAVAASASKARAAEARGDHGGAEGGGGGGGGMAGGHGEGKGAEGGNGDTGWDDDEEATYADGPTLRAYGVYSSLLKQHTAELRRADQQQRQLGQIATRNALRDERIAWLRSQRAVSELATREASLLSHRASAGYTYRRQLYRLAMKLQRERAWLEQSEEASRAYSHLRASEQRQAVSERYYREQIALLEERIRAARSDRATRERAQRDLLRSIEREVYEQQVLNVKAIQQQLEQVDNALDDEFDIEKGRRIMHSLNRRAASGRQHAWRGYQVR